MRTINNKKGKIMWYLLALILGVALIFMMVYFLFIGNKSNWQFLKNLPVNYTDEDKFIGLENLSEEELAALNCNVVGRINEDSYLSIAGVKSKLFYKEGEIYLDVSGWFSKDKKVGVIKDTRVLIENEFLGQDNFKLLNEAFLAYGTYFCKSDSQLNEQCLEKCEIYGGSCYLKDSLMGGVSYGQLDCKDGELCFVDLDRQKLNQEGLSIDKFGYIGKEGGKEISFLENERASFNMGEKGKITFLVSNSGTSKDFCVVLRSEDGKLLKRSFEGRGFTANLSWTVVNEQVLELFAWIPSEGKSVFKRVIIDLSGVERDYREGTGIYSSGIVTYKQFLSSALKKESSTYIVVSQEYIPVEDKSFKEFYFIQSKEKIIVFARKESKDKWERLDCYSDWFQIGGLLFDDLDLRVEDLKPTLKETMGKCDKI